MMHQLDEEIEIVNQDPKPKSASLDEVASCYALH